MSEKRRRGQYYTPPDIVRLMLHGVDEVVRSARNHDGLQTDSTIPTIVDPACGDGALLLAAFERIASAERVGSDREPCSRLQIVRRHLFGVDVDATAVERLRGEFLKRIGPSPADVETTGQAIAANIRVGDALTGSGLSGGSVDQPGPSQQSSDEPKPLDWARAFPAVAKNGGFDVVICNPPYLREKSAKPTFDRIAETPFGRRWREPRMDLWFYFLHRSLDVLRPGGSLTFIVNSYWTASTGARRIVERLRKETTLEHVILLGDRPVFSGVSGRHMIFRLRKEQSTNACRVLDLSLACSNGNDFSGDESGGNCSYSLTQTDLFRDRATIRFDRPDEPLAQLQTSRLLGDAYEVRQGIAENPPRLSRRHCEILGDGFSIGQGVFVLSAAEVQGLEFALNERELLRPYFRPAAISVFEVPSETDLSILYLTSETAPDLSVLPNIERHLRRFRPILERRRETRLGKVPWWHLHWPRKERLFIQPRILSVQMGRRPQFAWAEHATFVGFSINVVTANENSPFTLPALSGILNSAVARNWFERRAKKRGVNLEINGGLLRSFPLPAYDASFETELSRLVCLRQNLSVPPTGAEVAHVEELEDAIDRCVAALYDAGEFSGAVHRGVD